MSINALDEADTILALSTLELASIFNARKCLDLFSRMGYDGEKVKLVINRNSAQPHPTILKELEKSFGYPVFHKMPNENYSTVSSSINKGEPLSILSPDSKLGRSIFDLANRLCTSTNSDGDDEKSKKKSGFLKKLRKKREHHGIAKKIKR